MRNPTIHQGFGLWHKNTRLTHPTLANVDKGMMVLEQAALLVFERIPKELKI